MIDISACSKDTIKNRSDKRFHHINEFLEKKFQSNNLYIYDVQRCQSCFTVFTVSLSESSSCPLCHRPCQHVHKYYIRTLESLELFGMRVIIKVRVRYYYCEYADCKRRTFSEPLAIANRYARKTLAVERRILDTVLNVPARKASILLQRQHIYSSLSQCTRRAKSLGASNPPCKSTHIGIDDFAFKKGHVYMCMVCDHDTGRPVAVFDCRFGQELDKWLRENPQITLVTRDGSRDYARTLTKNLPGAIQVADRFHLVKNLLESVTESFQKMLYQGSEKLTYPWPCMEEAHGYMLRDIYDMGDKGHRDKVNHFLQIKKMAAEGYTRVEIAGRIGRSTSYVYRLIHGKGLPDHLSAQQKEALRYLPEVANIVSAGSLSVPTIIKKMKGRPDSYLIARMMRTLTAVYTEKRRAVRKHNKALKSSKIKKKVPVKSIRELLLKGETKDEKLEKMIKSNPDIIEAADLCRSFRRILKAEEGETTSLDEWIKRARLSGNKGLVKFAGNVEKDKAAVCAAINTQYSNARLEGAVNRVKAIKRTMFNRAQVKLLRAKIIYGE